jgi:hypothetical protein
MRLLPLLLVLVACDRDAPVRPPVPEAPPHGRGRYTDDQGQDHTLFRPLGVIRYGEERTGTVDDPRALLGYEFEARSGDQPVISLTLPKGQRGGLALYGPRGTEGLWDVALEPWVNGKGSLALSGITLDVPGMYFILVRSQSADALDYTLRLRCEGESCGEPGCPDVVACDLVCDTGYAVDEDGCRACACVAAACTPGPDACPEGERCVEGTCQAIPCAEQCPEGVERVCGSDGITYRNACTAECAGVESRPGVCDEMVECSAERRCPEGQLCRSGRCVADDCGCAPLRAPVCSQAGDTYPNSCLMLCAGATLDYPGPCVADACRSRDECEAGERCEPVPEPENQRRCRQNPQSLECIRQCVGENDTCGPGGPVCGQDQQCVQLAGLDRAGFCTQLCTPERGCPTQELACVTLPDRPDTGACLPRCTPESPRCPEGLLCQPSPEGSVCLPGVGCNCPVPGPEDVVCANGRELPSECIARCMGAREVTPGPCGAPPECACVPDRQPMMCGDAGGLFADACDARCAGQNPARPMRCLGDTPLACREDADCMVTGCEGTVCAAAATEACPPASGAARCRIELGMCGCFRPEGIEVGTCTFQVTREAYTCIEEVYRSR